MEDGIIIHKVFVDRPKIKLLIECRTSVSRYSKFWEANHMALLCNKEAMFFLFTYKNILNLMRKQHEASHYKTF